MKRYAFISVFLLIAFMWSCQTESSSPFSPEDLTTLATNSGDVTVTAAAKGGNDKGKGPRDKDATYSVWIFFGGAPVGSHTEAFMEPNWLTARNMGLNLTGDWVPECLPQNTYTGNLSLGQNINFFFKTNGVRYLLVMANGIKESGNWPPSDNVPTTFAGSELWLEFHGGGGRKNACDKSMIDIGWKIEVSKNQSP